MLREKLKFRRKRFFFNRNAEKRKTRELIDMPTITLNGSLRTTEILLETDSLKKLPEIIRKLNPSACFIVTDQNVGKIYLEPVIKYIKHSGIKTTSRVFRAGEKTKSISSLITLYDDFVEAHLDRNSLLIALGGGVIGDLATLAASTYMRGMQLLHIPTTLLAMADSCIGGKSAVNHKGIKNLMGSFYHPSAVLIDPAMLATLPQREYISGLAEVIKYAAIASSALLAILERDKKNILNKDAEIVQEIIEKSINIKISIVSKDEIESGERRLLNFGHTLAHALEAQEKFSRLLHGEAVSLGMVFALALSIVHGIGKSESALRIRQLLLNFGLPVFIDSINPDEIIELMLRDKKSVDRSLSFVLLKDIGQALFVEDINSEQVKKIIPEALLAKKP
ncbi:MAG: 3-dehydroquinate synthase [Planctomycetota bacterium]